MRRSIPKDYFLLFSFFAFFNVASFLFQSYYNIFLVRNFFYTLCLSLPFFIPSLFMGRHLKKYVVLCYPFLALAGLIDFLHIYIFQTGISMTVYRIVFETNINESRDFLETYFSIGFLSVAILYLTIPLILLRFLRSFHFQTNRKQFYIALILSVLVVLPSAYKGIKKHESPLA